MSDPTICADCDHVRYAPRVLGLCLPPPRCKQRRTGYVGRLSDYESCDVVNTDGHCEMFELAPEPVPSLWARIRHRVIHGR